MCNLLWISLFVLIGASARAEIAEDLPIKEKKPLFELGVGGGSGFFPHYPAADQGQWRPLALPTFRYRGSFLRADEQDGLRAKLISSPRYGVELSGAGALPASSDKNTARAGMPDLEWLGEGGPQLYVKLLKAGAFESRLLFPLRVAVSTNFSALRFRGVTFSPGIDVRMLLPKYLGAVRAKLSATCASKDYQRYFYDVPGEFANAERSSFESSGGYLGSRVDLGYSAERGRFAVFTQVGFNSFLNTANAASPLYKSNHAFSGILGMRWLLYQSDAKEEDRP